MTLENLRARFRGNRLALSAVVWLILITLGATLGLFLLPVDPFTQELLARLQPPMTASDTWFPHILGTDALGRDVLARVLLGARISLTVAACSVALAMVFGTTVGILAGYFRGIVDDILGRAIDVMIGFPGILAAMFLLFVVGPGFWNIVLVLALLRWQIYARVSRSLAMGIRELPYVESTRLLGSRHARVVLRHVLPNALSPILILATLEVAYVMLAEATLSFLGFGIQPPLSSWGVEVARSREYIRSAWWLITFPGLAIFLTTLSLNVLASTFRSWEAHRGVASDGEPDVDSSGLGRSQLDGKPGEAPT